MTAKQNIKRNALRSRGPKRKNTSQKRAVSDGNTDMALVASQRISRFTPTVFGFPDKLMSTLRYHSIQGMTSTTGALSTYGFRWNSIFDPDFSSSGHQPLYRDTYAAIYDHYSVVSARAKITFVNGTTSVIMAGVVTDDDSSPSSTVDTLCEQSHGFHALLTPLSGSMSRKEFRVNWSCKQVLGIDPFTSETYKTAMASNAAEESYLWMWVIDESGNTSTTTTDIELEYDVLFTELTTPSQS